MARTLSDFTLTKSVALPAAAGTASTAGIDLGNTTLQAAGEGFRWRVEVPATPNLANTKNLTMTTEDSADNVTFAAIAGLGNKVITGPSSGGGAAYALEVNLPPHTRRYVREKVVADSASGDVTAQSLTAKLVA